MVGWKKNRVGEQRRNGGGHNANGDARNAEGEAAARSNEAANMGSGSVEDIRGDGNGGGIHYRRRGDADWNGYIRDDGRRDNSGKEMSLVFTSLS